MSVEPIHCPECHLIKTNGCCFDALNKMMANDIEHMRESGLLMDRTVLRQAFVVGSAMLLLVPVYLAAGYIAWRTRNWFGIGTDAILAVCFGFAGWINARMFFKIRRRMSQRT